MRPAYPALGSMRQLTTRTCPGTGLLILTRPVARIGWAFASAEFHGKAPYSLKRERHVGKVDAVSSSKGRQAPTTWDRSVSKSGTASAGSFETRSEAAGG
jgi:hypothetical protein